ncbi:alpha-L-rhamnosidase [Ructibacterium gallinarum]|uniref:alpha-L-rhamnosidase n=1 Tax=Ructibacterium gallinarum TaxID=2779355 RepID=A0A9D5M0S8_9FIRM|nr:alpha-L-rhamnosidase [Ructibacterium gallinarum]MBE5040041.1 family 78 glycoside hydrolase catalytic domain [Ructibacterium gallinarum]
MKNAQWITGKNCIAFQKKFDIGKDAVAAKLWITAMGVYEAVLNGNRVGNFVLAPGFTSYNKRHLYQEYDITPMLKEENELNVFVGDGWYRGQLTWDVNNRNLYGDRCAMIAKMEITYPDRTETIYTDESWMCGNGPVVASGIYDGEIYDARIVPMFDQPAAVLNAPKQQLVPQDGEIVCEHERIRPVKTMLTPKGEKVIDFGQNLTGYVEFKTTAKAGDRIVISHAEVLDKDGNFYTENLRGAKQLLQYTCRDGEQVYKPHFTFMGFRYIRLDECPENTEFTAIVVHSDIKRTGDFVCSNEKVNQLFHNIIWGQKGNFLDVPTDCPQRDERLGWTGDAQVFVKTASFNFNVNRFFEKWLADLSADQKEDGCVSDVVPNVLGEDHEDGSAAWGDAAVICPWQMYLTYGNKALLARQFESMKRWVEYSAKKGRTHYGDWLALDGEKGNDRGLTDKEFISSAFHIYSMGLLIKSGKVLGKDMSDYEKRCSALRDQFEEEYECKTQTEHVLALKFHLTKNPQKLAAELAQMIKENGNRLKTGFVGTPYLLHALSENGYADVAYSLLLQEEFPSWLYSVNMGATTIWEHWDGIRPDGSFWSAGMNSFNHYAYGAVADWMYEVAAGIKIDENAPAFAHIIIEPIPDARLGFVKASIDTVNGKVSSGWKWENGKITYEIEVPTTATVRLHGDEIQAGKGKHVFCYDAPVQAK